VKGPSPATIGQLLKHRWPGNIREFRNVLLHAVLRAEGSQIRPEHLPESVPGQGAGAADMLVTPGEFSLKDALREPERRYILHALRQSDGNKQQTAQRLDISRSTLYKKLKCLDIDPEVSLPRIDQTPWPRRGIHMMEVGIGS
jgi:DNA-binding NtrC family response regulator